MLTDEQLTTKPKTARYVVSINHKSKTVPAFWLNCDSPTKKEAMEFAHEYAVRIIGFKRADYYLLVDKL